jgi:hypothetical protein
VVVAVCGGGDDCGGMVVSVALAVGTVVAVVVAVAVAAEQ